MKAMSFSYLSVPYSYISYSHCNSSKASVKCLFEFVHKKISLPIHYYKLRSMSTKFGNIFQLFFAILFADNFNESQIVFLHEFDIGFLSFYV